MTGSNGHRSLLTASSIYLVSNAANALIPFALLPILTRALGPTQYGEVAMFQTFLAVLSTMTGLSLHGAAGRKYFDLPDDPLEMRYYIGACFQLLAASSLVILAAVSVWQHELSAFLGIRPRWIVWAVFASAAGFIMQMRMTQWQVRKQALRYGAIQVSQSVLNMSVSVLLVVGMRRGADGRIEAMLCVPIALAVLGLVFLWRDGLLGMAWRPHYLREALRFGVPLVPHVGGLLLLSIVDRVAVNSLLGLAQAGIYMVAVQVAMGLALVFDSVNSAYVPWLYERLQRNLEPEKRQIVRYTYWYFGSALAAAVLAFIVGPAFVTLIAGAEYAEAGRVVGWLALGHAFAGMYLMVTNYVFYSRRTGLLSLATISSGLLGLALLWPLTRLYGLMGTAVSFAAAMLVRFMLTWWVAQRRHPMPWLTFSPES